MLIGAIGRPAADPDALLRASGRDAGPVLGDERARVAIRPLGVASLDALQRFAEDAERGSWLALSGRPYPTGDPAGEPLSAGKILAELGTRGAGAVADYDGGFAIAWYDGPTDRIHLFRDAFGREPLFYGEVAGGLVFGSRVADLLATGLLPGGISGQGLSEFLTYCYVPGTATLDRGLEQVPQGVRIGADAEKGVVETDRFYRVPFSGALLHDEDEIAERFRGLLEQAVLRQIDAERLGAFLSGGMDSSSIVTFTRQHREESIHTFSYRCAGKSFDESIYARALARAMKTEHEELEYAEQDALQIERAVGLMDVPVCDVGLEMGTWRVGRAADGLVDVVLTGDGGDEMWASHPVYAAQRLLDWYERVPVPGFVNRGFQRMVARLPDSDQKRDLRVKLKRILPPAGLPAFLGPSRWRAYYVKDALEDVLTPEYAAKVRDADPYACWRDAYDGYDGPDDGLSAHIYADYTGLTPYYFHRLRLMRRFGLEVRCPFYDRELVEFGARIPAKKKLEKIETTKRLFRQAMEGVLPDEINHRKDKLGHSIPLKNWIRDDGPLAARVAELCSPQAVRERGIFRDDVVSRLIDEHRERRHNHSHRIWSIYVLELWLRAREGRL